MDLDGRDVQAAPTARAIPCDVGGQRSGFLGVRQRVGIAEVQHDRRVTLDGVGEHALAFEGEPGCDGPHRGPDDPVGLRRLGEQQPFYRRYGFARGEVPAEPLGRKVFQDGTMVEADPPIAGKSEQCAFKKRGTLVSRPIGEDLRRVYRRPWRASYIGFRT